jgi:hypothetical protein
MSGGRLRPKVKNSEQYPDKNNNGLFVVAAGGCLLRNHLPYSFSKSSVKNGCKNSQNGLLLLVMSTISKRKDKRFDIEAYYRNESKTFWFGPLTIGTKAKHIDLVQRIFYCEQIVSVLAQNFWDEAKQFDFVWKLFKAK